ncbi:MAG: hypothetical protein WD690_01655 [Vicinamibacterales bacterium]
MSWKLPDLEKISQIVFIVMCLVVTTVAVQRLTFAGSGRAGAKAPPIAEGTRLRLHGDLLPVNAQASLVLALSTNCQFCTESMGFYRQLAELDVVRDGRLGLSVVSIQTPDQMREYLDGHRVPVGPIVLLRQSGVSIQGTPTVLLVRRDGVVGKSWAGQLTPDEEEDLVKAVRAAVSQ